MCAVSLGGEDWALLKLGYGGRGEDVDGESGCWERVVFADEVG